jgi:hypothetical protein
MGGIRLAYPGKRPEQPFSKLFLVDPDRQLSIA